MAEEELGVAGAAVPAGELAGELALPSMSLGSSTSCRIWRGSIAADGPRRRLTQLS